MIREGLIKEEGVVVGKNFDTGYNVVLRRGVVIGNGVSIWSNTVIDPDCVIKSGVKIHCNCYLAQSTVVDEDVFIAPNVITLNDRHPPQYNELDWEPVLIKKNASIGGGSILGPGVTIGAGSIIGAGSLVLKDVPDGQIWAGHPARRLR